MRDRAFNIPKNPKYGGYQRGLASIVYNFFGKRTPDGAIKNENMPNKKLAEELHKPMIRKFENQKLFSSFMGNIWSADLADMQLISNLIKEFIFYYVLLIFSVNTHGLFF